MLLQDYFTEMEDRTAFQSSVTSEKNKLIRTANNVLRRFYTKLKLVAEKDSTTLSTTSATSLYYLDPRVMNIVNMRETTDQQSLEYYSRKDFEKDYPYPASTETGQPSIYVPLRKLRVTVQPTSASALSIASSSASDTAVYVVVNGLSSGIRKTERLLLTGTSTVTSSNSYTELYAISKDATVGTVTVTSNSAAVTNISLLPAESFKEHWEVRLHQIPDSTYTIEYTFNVIPWSMVNDEDYIPLPDEYADAFLNECTADLLRKQGDAANNAMAWSGMGLKTFTEIEDANIDSAESDLVFGFPELDYNNNG